MPVSHKLLLVFVFCALLACGLNGCSPQPSPSNNEPFRLRQVVCTTGMVGDVVSALVGDEVEVFVLIGPGSDPHLFSPSPRDIEKLAQADAIFYSGLHLEAGLGNYLEKFAQKKPHVYALSTGIQKSPRLISVADGIFDPHYWNDLVLWGEATSALANKLTEWSPDEAELFQYRAANYQQELTRLLEESQQLVQSVPEDRRLLVTAHDAFGYLGKSLGLQVRAAQGISTNTEPSVKKVEELVKLIVSLKIPALFTESSVSDKAIRAILEGCQRSGHQVRLGGVLYSDSLGPVGSGAETFTGMYRHNIQTITDALK